MFANESDIKLSVEISKKRQPSALAICIILCMIFSISCRELFPQTMLLLKSSKIFDNMSFLFDTMLPSNNYGCEYKVKLLKKGVFSLF